MTSILSCSQTHAHTKPLSLLEIVDALKSSYVTHINKIEEGQCRNAYARWIIKIISLSKRELKKLVYIITDEIEE